MTTIRQYRGDPQDWPRADYHPVAILRLNPDEVERRYGITFTQSTDQLGSLLVALVRINDLFDALLNKHDAIEQVGVQINLPLTETDIAGKLNMICDALHLDASHLLVS